MSRTYVLLISLTFGWLAACGPGYPGAAGAFDLPEVVDYNFHIKPLLSDRCEGGIAVAHSSAKIRK